MSAVDILNTEDRVWEILRWGFVRRRKVQSFLGHSGVWELYLVRFLLWWQKLIWLLGICVTLFHLNFFLIWLYRILLFKGLIEGDHILKDLVKWRLLLDDLALLQNLIHLIMQKHPHVKDILQINQLFPMQNLLIYRKFQVNKSTFLLLPRTIKVLIDNTQVRLTFLYQHRIAPRQ